MAIKKVRLPNNTTLDIHDARVVSDAITYIGGQQGSATYVDGGEIIDVTTKADKVTSATNGNFAALDANGNLTDSGHKHSDYQAALVSGTNIKTINNQSLLGSGNITISGGSGGDTSNCVQKTGDTMTGILTMDSTQLVLIDSRGGWDNFWRTTGGINPVYTSLQADLDDKQAALVSGTNIKTINNQSVLGSGNLTISSDTSNCVHLSGTEIIEGQKTFNGDILLGEQNAILKQDIVSGFDWLLDANDSTLQEVLDTKGTYSKPSGGIPKTDLASAVQTSLGKADTALQSYTETDPTVPSWAKASSKPTYTASEVGALPDTTVVPTESTVSGWGFTKNAGTITGITMNGSSKGTSGVVNLGTVVTSESDPVFTASAAHGISSTDISNWNAKQKAITVSSSAPTSSQGSNGDIWIVI